MSKIVATHKRVDIWKDAMGYSCFIHPAMGHKVSRQSIVTARRAIDIISDNYLDGLLSDGPDSNQSWLEFITR